VASVGVVGSGGIAHAHLDAWQRLGVDIAVFSTNPAAAVVAERYGGRACASLDDLVHHVDVVDVCAPTDAHPAIVAAAASAGRQVVCEKPLALTHADAASMIDLCVAAGVGLYPAQVVRYFADYVAAKHSVDAGEIGTPIRLELIRRSAAPRSVWFADPARSGGVIVDLMIHDIDFARWIAGEVREVIGTVTPGPFAPQEIAAVELRHESGAVSRLIGGWEGPEVPFQTSFSIVGERGSIRRSSEPASSPIGALPDDGAHSDDHSPETTSPFLDELAEFLTAIEGGPPARVTAEDSLAALDIALAAKESAASGRAVRPGDLSGR
jgi:myo-inositol 2-dehydrogenase/D-chiro-inositol 1-dehydrogenase